MIGPGSGHHRPLSGDCQRSVVVDLGLGPVEHTAVEAHLDLVQLQFREVAVEQGGGDPLRLAGGVGAVDERGHLGRQLPLRLPLLGFGLDLGGQLLDLVPRFVREELEDVFDIYLVETNSRGTFK